MIRSIQTVCGLPLFYNTYEEDPTATATAAAAEAAKADVVAAEEAKAAAAKTAAAAAATAAAKPAMLSLTKEDLQKKINEALDSKAKETEETNKSLMQEMDLLKTRSSLSADESKAHDARVKELEEKLLTTEELAKREKQKISAAKDKEANALTSERDYWSNLYHKERIMRGITDASAVNDAVSPEQMVSMMANSTELVEKDGPDGTKVYDVITSIPDKDVDGKSIVLKLEVSKAIEHMSQQPRYFNLFKSALKSGFSGSGGTGGTGGEPSEEELAKDPKKWREHSKRKRGLIK